MEIKICGPGCAECDETYSTAVKMLGQDVTVNKITDFREIAVLGIFSTPAVVIDGVVKCIGRSVSEDEIYS